MDGGNAVFAGAKNGGPLRWMAGMPFLQEQKTADR